MDCFLDGCPDGTDCFWLWFPALTGLGVVVLLATCATRGPAGGALVGSGFTIGPGMGWSSAVSTCGGTVSGAPPGVRLRAALPFVNLVLGLYGANCGCGAEFSALMGVSELDQLVDIGNVAKESLCCAVLLEVTVIEACHDYVVQGSLNVADGDEALVAELLELAVSCDSSVSGSERFGGLFW